MDSYDAIVRGGIAGKPQFLGTGTAEVIARRVASVGGWNDDFADTVHSLLPWYGRGSTYSSDSDAGIFSIDNVSDGSTANSQSHRTILSGY